VANVYKLCSIHEISACKVDVAWSSKLKNLFSYTKLCGEYVALA
jgi:hypothetical protein